MAVSLLLPFPDTVDISSFDIDCVTPLWFRRSIWSLHTSNHDRD